MNNMMNNKKVSFDREFYEKYGERQSIWKKSPDDPLVFHEKLRSHRMVRYCPSKPITVLDCGCGDGYLAVLTKPKVKQVVGLDFSVNRLKNFTQKALKNKIYRIAGDSCQLPIKNESFDVILVSELLEHVAEDEKMLQEIHSSLKEGGQLILSVPYKEMINTVICPKCHHEFYRHGHLRSYDKPKLKQQLKKVGFQYIRFYFSNNAKTRRMRGKRFLPFKWVVRMDVFFSFIFPRQNSFLIALAEK